MKNVKKIIALACATLLTVGAFAGCGQKQQATNDDSKNQEQQEQKEVKNVKLALWEQDDAITQKVLDGIIKDFQSKNSNITVTRTHYETEDLRKNFLQAATSSSGPDLVLGPNDNIGVFATGNMIVPIDEVVGNDTLGNYDETALKAGKYLGKQYMFPDRNGNEILLIYNKKLVKEAPEKWEDLEKIGKDLKGKIQYTIAFNEVEPFFSIPFLKAFGGEVFDDVNAEKPKATLNTDAVKKWSQFLKRIHDEKVIPKEADGDVAANLFKEGKVPFLIDGPWRFKDLKENNIDFGIAPIPSINGNDSAATSAVKGYTVSKKVMDDEARKDAVKKFLEFVNNKDNQLKMVDAHKQLPTLKEALKDSKITDDPLIAGQKAALEKCIPMPIIPQMRAIWDSMKPAQQKILVGKLKPEDAPAWMQKKAEEGMKALGF